MPTTHLTVGAGEWGSPLREGDPRGVGPYRIHRRLGAGGMATVYLGRDAGGDEAAVKVVRADLAADPDFSARFAREVRVLSSIDSPAVARVLGADATADPPWLAVEFVPGASLSAVTACGPLPLADWSVLAVQLLHAVAALHAVGVVHRDLSPGNVILGPDGPKIIDFGIALAPGSTRMTRTGHSIGTPGWMAPEQLGGRAVDAAADVYSAGCLLALAATGRPPHGAGTRQEVTHRVLQAPVDVDGLPALQQVFLRELTAKEPSRRPSAAAAAQRWTDVSEVVTQATTLTVTRLWPSAVNSEAASASLTPRSSLRDTTAPRRRGGRSLAVVLPVAAVALAIGVGAGVLLTDDAPTLPATGPSPGTSGGVVEELPVASGDPTSQQDLESVQAAVRAADHTFPGGSARVLEVLPAEGDEPTRLSLDITAAFTQEFDGDYELDVLAEGMGGTSARYSTCLDVPAGETVRQQLSAADDSAGQRWTSMTFQLVESPQCQRTQTAG